MDGEHGRALEVVEAPELSASGEILVSVEAVGVSQPDVLQIDGGYQVTRPPPFVPGSEVVGRVISAPNREEWLGQRVIALTPDGGWQERVWVSADTALAVPEDLTAEQAALMLVNYVTAHFGLVTRGAARSGETVLVRGAAGGLGSAVLHLGSWLGLRTIAVVSSPEKAAYASRVGAEHVILEPNWREAVTNLAPRGVDLVFDPVGGDQFVDSMRVLSPGGRVLIAGFLGGAIPQVKINRLLLNNISLMGLASGAYMQQHPGELMRQWEAVLTLRARVDATIPEPTLFEFRDAAAAVELLRSRRAVGKVVLRP